MAEIIEEVTEPGLLDSTFIEKMDTTNVLLAAIASGTGGYPIKSYADVQSITRLGLAPKVFSIGDIFEVTKETSSDTKVLQFVITNFNGETPVDKTKKYSIQLQLLDCYNSIQYDNTEALYYCEQELSAGTYNFTLLANYDVNYGGGQTYQFTLTKSVPAGGVIMFPWSYNTQASATKVSTYESRQATSAIETVTASSGDSGVSLGTADGKSTNMNHTHRIRYGSNNWKESAMRQWLNSNAKAGTFWAPQTVFDRPPSWEKSLDGWMNGLDTEFLAVLGKVKLITARNTVNEDGGSDITEDLFYLPSRPQIYGGKENNIDEGEAWEYYSANSDNSSTSTRADKNRIKYLNNNKHWWWIRTPSIGYAGNVFSIYADGSLHNHSVYDTLGAVPACSII